MSDRSALFVSAFVHTSRGSRTVTEDIAVRLGSVGWNILKTSSSAGRIARVIDMVYTTWTSRHRYSVAQVDVFSGPAFLWAELVCWILRTAHKPYVLVLHGGDLPRFSAKWGWRVRRLLGSAAVVVTPSRYLQGKMAAYVDKVQILPNPLDVGAYRFQLRKQARPKLVWLRAFHTLYNPELAVRTLALLSKEFPEIELTMVGPDKGDGSLQCTRDLAKQLGLAERVKFSGPIPKRQVPSTLEAGDIFLNTTHVDNTPISVLEAMATGLCIVSTDVGGIPYLLESGSDGLLVRPDNAVAMADAVRRILNQPHCCEALSSNARRRVEQFDWAHVLPSWDDLLTSVASSSMSRK